MNILLTGASGQLGRELLPRLDPLGRVIPIDRDILPGDERTLQADLGDLAGVDRLLDDQDVKEFYLGLGRQGSRKSYRDVNHYKRRKRWLS